jgi:hypothetical protein
MWPIHNNNILSIEGSKPLYLVFIMSRFSATLSKKEGKNEDEIMDFLLFFERADLNANFNLFCHETPFIDF